MHESSSVKYGTYMGVAYVGCGIYGGKGPLMHESSSGSLTYIRTGSSPKSSAKKSHSLHRFTLFVFTDFRTLTPPLASVSLVFSFPLFLDDQFPIDIDMAKTTHSKLEDDSLTSLIK